MEFYASQIYTAVNADKLRIGSECIFANTLEELRQRVQAVNVEDCTKKSSNWYYDANIKYFVSDKGTWIYAYLIKPTKEIDCAHADELKIANKFIFLDKQRWRKKVQDKNISDYISACVKLYKCDRNNHFLVDCHVYNYAYLTEPPAKAIKEHYGWVTKLFRNLRARYRICHYIIKKVFNKYIESTNTDFTMDLRKD